MNEFLEATLLSLIISGLVVFASLGLKILFNKIKLKKEKILTNREYYSIVFGILLIVQGSAMITIYTPPSVGFDFVFLGIGTFLIIGGALLEVYTHTNLKKSISELKSRIEKLEDP